MRLGKGIRVIKLINLQIEGMQEIEMFFFLQMVEAKNKLV